MRFADFPTLILFGSDILCGYRSPFCASDFQKTSKFVILLLTIRCLCDIIIPTLKVGNKSQEDETVKLCALSAKQTDKMHMNFLCMCMCFCAPVFGILSASVK